MQRDPGFGQRPGMFNTGSVFEKPIFKLRFVVSLLDWRPQRLHSRLHGLQTRGIKGSHLLTAEPKSAQRSRGVLAFGDR